MNDSSVNVDTLMTTTPPSPMNIPDNIRLLLAPDHRIDLKNSGLSDATIAAAGIAAVPPNDIAKVIGYNIPDVLSAYTIPFGNGFNRIKVFYAPGAKPAPGKKLRKYHQKAGTGNKLYFSPTLIPTALADIEKTIYLVEGEKKSLKAVQDGILAVGFTGVWNWKRKGTDELIPDFSKISLDGRDVVIVPDSDWKTKGKNLIQAIERFARALQLAGANVSILNLPVEGDEKVGLDDYLVKHGVEKFNILTPEPFPVTPCCRVEGSFLKYYETKTFHILDANGKRTGDTYERYEKPVIIADAIEVIAYGRSAINEDWGIQLEFKDKQGFVHRWFMSFELMSRDGEAVRKELLNKGVFINALKKYRDVLNNYLQITEPELEVFALCTKNTGWHDGDFFMLPDTPIGNPDSPVIYQGSNKNVTSRKGTLDEWIATIGKYCIGNSRLAFAVSVAFAATIIYICGKENGGFHMKGKSSSGKSSTLFVAASVFGSDDYITNWDGTKGGHEGCAAEHNDLLLIMDEISEADAKTLGNTIYMLANGSGKKRLKETAESRPVRKWRNYILSSGEVGLSDIIAGEGKKVKAGQEIRLCDIPANVGKYGVFDELHGHEDGSKFAVAIKKAAKENYGLAGVAFIQNVIKHRESIIEFAQEMENHFHSTLPAGSDGQIIRVSNRFAHVAAAGELATEWGLTGWPKGEATKASLSCLEDWICTRGGVMPHEVKEALTQVRHFFANHGSSRFTDWQLSFHSPQNRAGFKRLIKDEYEYFVFPDVFKKEICAGLNHTFVSSLLIERGILMATSGSATTNVRLPELGQTRCYHITSKVFEVEP